MTRANESARVRSRIIHGEDRTVREAIREQQAWLNRSLSVDSAYTPTGTRNVRKKGVSVQETFVCDRCGQEFPQRQLKEAFTGGQESREREELCPSCLDIRMNEADRVTGVAGEDKRAAVRLGNEDDKGNVLEPPREPIGERDQGRDLGNESQEQRQP